MRHACHRNQRDKIGFVQWEKDLQQTFLEALWSTWGSMEVISHLFLQQRNLLLLICTLKATREKKREKERFKEVKMCLNGRGIWDFLFVCQLHNWRLKEVTTVHFIPTAYLIYEGWLLPLFVSFWATRRDKSLSLKWKRNNYRPSLKRFYLFCKKSCLHKSPHLKTELVSTSASVSFYFCFLALRRNASP